jgi:cytochrome c biogenesis protein CcmG, thiol:disulfide interchange protein DsbE
VTDQAHASGAADRLRAVGQVLALALVAALLALLAWKVVQGNDGGAAGALAKGESPDAPAFTLPRLDSDGELSLDDLKGKAVVVNFWASWCIPCKDEAPFLQETYERYRDRGLVVLGVDAQDFRQDARGFMSRFDLTYPVVHDGKGSTLGVWGVTGFPETFFVDRQGRLVGERITGGVDIERNSEAFERNVEQALDSG